MTGAIDDHTLAWLLEPENPSVRYWALRDVLRRAEDDVEVVATRAAIPASPVVQRIFARQAPEGYWGDPTEPYRDKYKASFWTLMVLGYLGLDRHDERVDRAVQYLFQFQQPNGGFAIEGREGALRDHARYHSQKGVKRQAPKDIEEFVIFALQKYTLSCLTGNVVAALLRLGYADDARVWQAVDWLVSIQYEDGGWKCPYWPGHVKDKHSCFYGSITSLEAFSLVPPERRTPAIRAAAARGAEFLLMHRLYRADHHDWEIIRPWFLRLTFPWFYGYDILRGLWVLTRLGVRDERMDDALDVLRTRRQADGRWLLDSTPYGQMQANLEKKGQPSQWITLLATTVLQAHWQQ